MNSRDPERPPYNVQCPRCGVFAGQPCRTLNTRRVTDVHSSRFVRAYAPKGGLVNAHRDRSEQPCTDTRCDAPTHPLDTEGAHLPPITEPIALGDPESVALDAPESPAAPDTSTGTPETPEGAREAHSEPQGLPEWLKHAEVALLRAEIERQEGWYADLHRRTRILDGLLAVERARVARARSHAQACAVLWHARTGGDAERDWLDALAILDADLSEPDPEGRA